MTAWLKEPQLHGQIPGTLRFFATQKAIIRQRPLLKWCYDDWYGRLLADARSVISPGLLVELGSGGSYLKELEPSIITSDVVAGVADQIIDGRHLPFTDDSVKALFLTHVFHHIPDVSAFLNEAQRVLVPGGIISMIEVAHTPLARIFFKNFHPEPYRDQCQEWSFAQNDSMMDSNQALAWMVFERDRTQFEKQFPQLEIKTTAFLPWLAYLLSGGVTMRQMIPNFLNGPIRGMERALSPLAPVFALHWHLCVKKKNAAPAVRSDNL